jgi:hypothetical protein
MDFQWKSSIIFFLCLVAMLGAALGLSSEDAYAQLYENKSVHTFLVPQLANKNLRNGAKIDFDADGLNDLFVTFSADYFHSPPQGTFSNDSPKLYKGSWLAGYDTPRFVDAPCDCWGDPIQDSTCGIQFADFDNDGDLDFYAPNPNGHQLFERDGDFFFDVTEEVGLNDPTVFGAGTGSVNGAWGDFDGDCFVDLLVVYFNSDAPEPATIRQTIWRNVNGVEFEDSFISSLPNFDSSDNIVSSHWVDFDNDNDVDLVLSQGRYVTNNSNYSTYWENTGVGGAPDFYLVEVPTAFSTAGMKMNKTANLSAVADMNNDGFLDLVYENGLRYGILTFEDNNGVPSFNAIDTSTWPQPDLADNVWDVAPFDANLDGINDMVTSKFKTDDNNHMRSMLYFGQIPGPDGGEVGFSDVAQHFSDHDGCHTSQGLCAADFLNDGRTELFISQDICNGTHDEPRFFWDVSNSQDTGNWVSFTLDLPNYPVCNRAAIGANLILSAPGWGAGHTQAKFVDGGSGRASQGDFRLVYGLGNSFSGTVDVEAVLPSSRPESSLSDPAVT